MFFYFIGQAHSKYQLSVEDDCQVTISEEQLALVAKELSGIYQQREQMPLGLRTYITLYYDSGRMEYVSLSNGTEILLSPSRRVIEGYGDESLDGFAFTLLEGEEENRIWLGTDGSVENRGTNQEDVEKVLGQLIESLNQDVALWEKCAQCSVEAGNARWLSSFAKRLVGSGLCDQNQELVLWVEELPSESKALPLSAVRKESWRYWIIGHREVYQLQRITNHEMILLARQGENKEAERLVELIVKK